MKNKSTFELPLPSYYKDNSGEIIEEDPEPTPTWQRRVKKVIKKRLPIFGWLPKYKKGDLVADLIAGVTVGLTVVPQSMAYAAIAGLSPEYGLYSSYFTCLVYVILGSCRQAAIGPTAVMGLLTFQTCGNDNPSCAILTAFYSGVFELAMAILSLGWVVSFISEPVTIGFTAGASVTIMSSQVKSLFGISGPKGDGFVGYWEAIIRDISHIHLGDSILGVTCVIALLLLRKLKDLIPIEKPSPVVRYTIWLISTAKNVIIVIVTTIIAWLWQDPPFKIVGHVQGGFPPITVPEFELPKMEAYNATLSGDDIERLSFIETWQYLKAGPFIIAVIAVLQNVAISKAFGSGQSVDATQEMYALGICNVFGSFIKAIPTSGSFSRSAVNEASGVRSPMGSMFTGLLVIFSLGLLTPSFYYIPKASLAAVIMTAVYFMIEFEALKPMWRISKVDFVVCLITFAVALYLGMEYGIAVGVGLSIGNILLKSLKPVVHRELRQEGGVKYFIITPEAGLFFPSVDFVRTYLNKLGLKQKRINIFVLNFAKWKQYDYTAANALASLVKGFNKNKKILQFTNCSEEWSIVLQDAGLGKPPILNWNDIPEFVKKSSTVLVLPTPTDIVVDSAPNGSTNMEETNVSSTANGESRLARAS